MACTSSSRALWLRPTPGMPSSGVHHRLLHLHKFAGTPTAHCSAACQHFCSNPRSCSDTVAACFLPVQPGHAAWNSHFGALWSSGECLGLWTRDSHAAMLVLSAGATCTLAHTWFDRVEGGTGCLMPVSLPHHACHAGTCSLLHGCWHAWALPSHLWRSRCPCSPTLPPR